MPWSFFWRYGERLVALVSGIASDVLAIIAASHETSGQARGFWLSSWVCSVLAGFLMWREDNSKLREAMTKLEARSLTAAQIQTGRNQLAVLGQAEQAFVKQLLSDRYLRSDQIWAWHSEDVLHNVRTHTTFLYYDRDRDRFSVDEAEPGHRQSIANPSTVID